MCSVLIHAKSTYLSVNKKVTFLGAETNMEQQHSLFLKRKGKFWHTDATEKPQDHALLYSSSALVLFSIGFFQSELASCSSYLDTWKAPRHHPDHFDVWQWWCCFITAPALHGIQLKKRGSISNSSSSKATITRHMKRTLWSNRKKKLPHNFVLTFCYFTDSIFHKTRPILRAFQKQQMC